MEYGIQMYSLRDITEKDLKGALKKVADMGYKFVEFAGFFGVPAEEVKATMDECGLRASGAHVGLNEIWEHFDETVAYHKAIGNENLIIPGHDLSSQAKLDDFVDKVNTLAIKLAGVGMHLGYHNHAHEFKCNEDGSMIEEQLIYRTGLELEIDTYWAYVGMGHPLELMERLKDRLKFIHIKDGNAKGEGNPLGMGTAPVAEVYKKAKAMGVPMVVESETLTPDGATEAKICIDFLFAQEK